MRFDAISGRSLRPACTYAGPKLRLIAPQIAQIAGRLTATKTPPRSVLSILKEQGHKGPCRPATQSNATAATWRCRLENSQFLNISGGLTGMGTARPLVLNPAPRSGGVEKRNGLTAMFFLLVVQPLPPVSRHRTSGHNARPPVAPLARLAQPGQNNGPIKLGPVFTTRTALSAACRL